MVAENVCLRCGAKVSGQQVFCDDCQAYTQSRPVNPNAPVLLPHRTTVTAPRKRLRRRVRKPEEQIHVLKNWIAWLVVLMTALLVGLTLSVMLNCQLLGVTEIDFLPNAEQFISDLGLSQQNAEN